MLQVGTPNASLREYMMLDHCGMLDSCEWFAVKNCGKVKFLGHKVEDRGKEWPATMSMIEWYYVVDPSPDGLKIVNDKLAEKDRKPLRNWPMEVDDLDHDADGEHKPTTSVRRKEPLATFMREAKLRKIDKQLVSLRTDQLREEEVISARLYTGPVRAAPRVPPRPPLLFSLGPVLMFVAPHAHGTCVSADVLQVQLGAACQRRERPGGAQEVHGHPLLAQQVHDHVAHHQLGNGTEPRTVPRSQCIRSPALKPTAPCECRPWSSWESSRRRAPSTAA